jgi:CheY-like chemotaxis protein
MQNVLVADNHRVTADKISEKVANAGYSVVTAYSPGEARRILKSGTIDLAILDLKLDDDSDEDISGLDVARETAPTTPKIIVSNYSRVEDLINALGANLEGLPAVIAFLQKDRLALDLLPAVRHALEVKKTWLMKKQEEIKDQLTRDYTNARRVAHWHTWVSFALSIIFALPILFVVWALHGDTSSTHGNVWTMVFIFLGSLGAEITNYLFARKVDFHYDRVDRFHAELLQARRFDQLLAACEELKDEPARNEFHRRILEAAVARWFVQPAEPGKDLVPFETSTDGDARTLPQPYSA